MAYELCVLKRGARSDLRMARMPKANAPRSKLQVRQHLERPNLRGVSLFQAKPAAPSVAFMAATADQRLHGKILPSGGTVVRDGSQALDWGCLPGGRAAGDRGRSPPNCGLRTRDFHRCWNVSHDSLLAGAQRLPEFGCGSALEEMNFDLPV
jgi:hypothetical protein